MKPNKSHNDTENKKGMNQSMKNKSKKLYEGNLLMKLMGNVNNSHHHHLGLLGYRIVIV